jgi:two-component system sensor histidine kinase YesM
MRYEDKFDFEIRLGEGLSRRQVLRLILQPLVENAIYHGIKERRGNGKLLVEVSETDGELLLIVRDDGIGMDHQRLESLNAALDSLDFGPEGLGKGYGIRNVHERIVLTFGLPFGLRFAQAPGGGTEARIRHPLLDAEGE